MLDLFAKKSIQVTGFWVAETARRFPEIVREMKSAGHEIGAHSLYHETIGDSLFEIPGIYPLLPEEVFPRIEKATSIVEDIIGEKVVSWRCPRLFGGTEVTNSLETLGYECDATYPMYYYGNHLFPYHPSKDSWLYKGSLNLIEIIQDQKTDYNNPIIWKGLVIYAFFSANAFYVNTFLGSRFILSKNINYYFSKLSCILYILNCILN